LFGGNPDPCFIWICYLSRRPRRDSHHGQAVSSDVQLLFIAILLWPAKKIKRRSTRSRQGFLEKVHETVAWKRHWAVRRGCMALALTLAHGGVGRDYIGAELQALKYPCPKSLKDLHLPHNFILTTEGQKGKNICRGTTE